MKKMDTLQSLHPTRNNRKPLTLLRSYVLTVFFLSAFCFLPSPAWAKNYHYKIKQEQTVSQIQTELQEIIDKAADNDTIFVTGSKTNADVTLYLFIRNKIVVWQAHYQSISPFGSDNLIYLSNNGAFIVDGGMLITENALLLFPRELLTTMH